MLLSYVDSPFFLKITLSFAAGCLWVPAATVITERYGPRIGGLIVGLPSTMLITLFFIGWTASVDAAAHATAIMPAINGVNCIFITIYVCLLQKGFQIALPGAFAAWFILSLGLLWVSLDNFFISVVLYISLFWIARYVLGRKPRKTGATPATENKRMRPRLLLLRGIFSGLVVVSAVVLALAGGPLVGGLTAMFPAMFTGTMYVTYYTYGTSFSAAVLESSILSTVSCLFYAAAVRYFYPLLGLGMGTAASILVSYSSAFLTYRYFNGK